MTRLIPLTAALALTLAAAAPPPAGAETRAPESRTEITLSFAPVVKKAAPAVVNIYTRRVVERQASPFAGDPFFEQFFRNFNFPGRKRIENSLGSGVLLSADGIVVTNHHVVGGADEITALLSDRREFEATVLLDDEQSDIAVLKLKGAKGLPYLETGDSDALEVGDLVLAIGNPFGVGQTVTSGIISGLARSGQERGGGHGYYIQTDAAINPGNSGGALVDMKARLVGINTSILTRSGGSNGIGFALPANLVRQVVAQAEAGHKHVVRPWAGFSGQAVDDSLAEGLGLSRPEGLIVADINPRSPFAKAGLGTGDVLMKIGDYTISTPAELDFRLAALGVGRTAEVQYLHDGRTKTVEVKLTAPPEDPPRDRRELEGPSPLTGLTVANVNPALAEELGLGVGASGVIVLDATRGARRAGFQPGDMIVAVNDAEVQNTRALAQIARHRKSDWRILVERDGRRGVLSFRG